MKILSTLLVAGLTAGAAFAEESETVTLDAYSVWAGTGTVLGTGPDSHSFAGEMRGAYFVDLGKGAIPAGEIACVGMLVANERDGRQTANALCRLNAADGAVAYGRFSCEGYRLVGCSGRFEITGGEGRMEGATGEGSVVMRRFETALVPDDSGRVIEAGLGIVSWKDFSVTLKAKAE